MFRLLKFLIPIFFLPLMSTAAVLYSEDFNNPNTGHVPNYYGDWLPQYELIATTYGAGNNGCAGKMGQAAASTDIVSYKPSGVAPAWTDTTIYFNTFWVSGYGWYFVFRYTEGVGGYAFFASPARDNEYTLYKFSGDDARSNQTQLDTINSNEFSTAYSEITISGNSISIEIENVGTLTTTDSTYTSGTIGVCNKDGGARSVIDNLTVSEIIVGTPTATPTITPTVTITPTITLTVTPTPTITQTITITPTVTLIPTASYTRKVFKYKDKRKLIKYNDGRKEFEYNDERYIIIRR